MWHLGSLPSVWVSVGDCDYWAPPTLRLVLLFVQGGLLLFAIYSSVMGFSITEGGDSLVPIEPPNALRAAPLSSLSSCVVIHKQP